MKKLLALAGFLSIAYCTFTLGQNPASNGWGGASWVWDQPDAHQTPQTDDPRYLRRTFDLAGKTTQAELWITADNHYVVYVNGPKIGEDGEWNTVEKYDVAKHLKAGKNVLAIKATNAGGPAGVIARLYVKTADKKEHFIVTDQRCKITQTAAKDWLSADFDDAAWFGAIELGDAGIGPWNIAAPPANAGGSPGKGPKAYGSAEVDAKVKTRLSAEEEKKHFVVPKDFEIELVATDPVVINPITMVLDDRGRIIVSESHTYRYGPPGSPIKPFANPVIRLDPDGKGGFTRTLVADGFDDPVMGIAIKGDKLWLTANNYLYTYDIDEANLQASLPRKGEASLPRKGGEKGIATNKKAILTDKNKAWNPFGMFVLEWGPDGMLYMSVGDHKIDIHGPDGKITGRGNSGIVMRMKPDGTRMERLVHGLRVPYSFEYDPFGQLWLLSNGEGNPDRFVRVIDGVDYHCYSRQGVDNNWLAGNHPLAPPCEEVHGGAHTQLMRYYAAAYPAEYQGNLFTCNWGRHGFAGPNRGIFRFVLDDRNNVVKKETLVACTDPHFRPSHIILDPDGNLLIADWYGRDDESDMTGRIWRLKYVGKNAPVVKHKLDSAEWKNDDYAIEALGSPDHLIREKAAGHLAKIGDKVVGKLEGCAKKSLEPLAAANALWTLHRIGTNGSKVAIVRCHGNPDWRVRRLVADLSARQGVHAYHELVAMAGDKDPAVRVKAWAILNNDFAPTYAELVDALQDGAANDVHLRYEAAWHLVKYTHSDGGISKLLTSDNANVRLAGLIAIDVACYENFPSKKAALAALAKALESPGKLDHQLLLMVAQLDGDASIVPALEKLIARDDLPTATIAKAVLVLKAKSGGNLAAFRLSAAAGKRLIEAVEKGSLKIASPADQLVIFEFLESEGPTPFALKQIAGQLQSNNKELRQAAHTLARRFGTKAWSLAPPLHQSLRNPKTKFDDAIENLSTFVRIGNSNSRDYFEDWPGLLNHPDRHVRTEVVRWWRIFKGDEKMTALLALKAPKLIEEDGGLKDDLQTVFKELAADQALIKSLNLPPAETDKATLTKYALKELADMPTVDRPKRVAMGLQVFERNACTKCHTTATQTTLLAPSLKGVGAQKVDYLIESVLFPSKIVKTGWEVETLELKSGRTVSGLVKDDGKHWRVLNLDKDERILKSDVESRAVSKTSIMPEGQEAQLSRREFVDLIAYLATLK